MRPAEAIAFDYAHITSVNSDGSRYKRGEILSPLAYHGVTTPRVMFDFLDWPSQNRFMHLVDPFLGIDNSQSRNRLAKYNMDPDFVRRQYPDAAAVRLHRGFIPDCLPLPQVDHVAFIHLASGDHLSEAKSLPHFYDKLTPGGIMVIDDYAIGEGQECLYRSRAFVRWSHTVLVSDWSSGYLPTEILKYY